MKNKKEQLYICNGTNSSHQCHKRKCLHRKPHNKNINANGFGCGDRKHNNSDRFCIEPGSVSPLDGNEDGCLVSCYPISIKEKPKSSYTKNYILAEHVVNSFIKYLTDLQKFKDQVGLKDVENIFEVATSIADKSGRICRQIKHLERNDPKKDYKFEIIESIQGFLAYVQMIINEYDITKEDIVVGMLGELHKSIKQHSKKEQND